MPVIKAVDLLYGRLSAPDLGAMEAFLTHFGMQCAERTPDILYMRGTDPSPYIHITERGEPRFHGIAFAAGSAEDLERLARLPEASAIETVDAPAGGRRVRLREPNGYTVEVLHGVTAAEPIAVAREPANSGAEPLRRAGRVLRLADSPAPVKRIGHAVLGTPRLGETVRWFRDTLGLIRSDDIYDGSEDNVIAAFSRLDRGDDYVDHHALFCAHNPERAGLNHLSFEVPDIDAVLKDHEYLSGLGLYEHVWGVGRHLLGSQVFDYWSDPWGRVHERWADTDRLNAADGGNLLTPEQGLQSQWGARPPDSFVRHVSQ